MQDQRTVVGFDTETHQIAAGRIAPPIVCLSYAFRKNGSVQASVVGRADGDDLRTICRELLEDKSLILVAHNAAYDMAVIGKAFPELLPLIFQAYQDERVRDTGVRERLWMLSTHGNLEFIPSPDGRAQRRGYKLVDLERLYLGRDRGAAKDDEDAWRLHYAVLESMPTSQWPVDAYGYARDDAVGALEVYEAQCSRFNASGPGSACGEEIHVYSDFCLFLMTCRGIAVDAQAHATMRASLEAELSPARLRDLVEAGILVPAREPMPRMKEKVVVQWDIANAPRADLRRAVEGAWRSLGHEDYPKTEAGAPSLQVKDLEGLATTAQGLVGDLEHFMVDEGLQHTYPALAGLLTMRKATKTNVPATGRPSGAKERIAQKALRAYVARVCAEHNLPMVPTPGGEASLSEAALEQLVPLDPIIEQYAHREKYRKLLNEELPRMCGKDAEGKSTGVPASEVHFCFNVLVETGRTSSYASDKYPSANGQNVDPRVRPIYVPRPGMLFVSCDYSALEMCSLANTLVEILGAGQSRMADLINRGIDPHTYFGALLAAQLDPNFRDTLAHGGVTEHMAIYGTFAACEKDPRPQVSAWFKHWRTFAKPPDLGLGGGLGAKGLVAFAKNNYGVEMTIETAKQLIELWLQAFPEMRLYFKWVRETCPDPEHPLIGTRVDEETGEVRPIKGYAYTFAGGTYRAACPYTAACNGRALQSPSAVGAKLGAVIDVTRACYDVTRGSILYGCWPLDFIHDEVLVELPDDEYASDRADEICRLMASGMSAVMPHVKVGAKPAMMRRWHKEAGERRDARGRLIPWEPAQHKG